MTHTQFEPFLHHVDVTFDSALVAWGGSFFERPGPGNRWMSALSQADEIRRQPFIALAQPG